MRVKMPGRSSTAVKFDCSSLPMMSRAMKAMSRNVPLPVPPARLPTICTSTPERSETWNSSAYICFWLRMFRTSSTARRMRAYTSAALAKMASRPRARTCPAPAMMACVGISGGHHSSMCGFVPLTRFAGLPTCST